MPAASVEARVRAGGVEDINQRRKAMMIAKSDVLERVKTNGKVASRATVGDGAGPSEAGHSQAGPPHRGLRPSRRQFRSARSWSARQPLFSRNKECVHALSVSSLCIVPQGAKTVSWDRVYEYNASRMIVFSVALPVAAQVTRASPSEPYLSLRLDLDPHKIAELVLKVFPRGLPLVQERSAVYLTAADAGHSQRRDEVNGVSCATRGR